MYIVIFTGGLLADGKFVRDALTRADLIIAADSGASTALDFGVSPAVVIGDFDSIDRQTGRVLRGKGCKFIVCDREKDETDTELAINYALEDNASEITILGGIEGDRIDHILANIFLLTNTTTPIRCINGSTVVWAEKGPKTVRITGHPKDILSLIPLTSEVTDIKTDGLQYSLDHETLTMGKPRGVSNVLIKEQAVVTFGHGTLLLVHTIN